MARVKYPAFCQVASVDTQRTARRLLNIRRSVAKAWLCHAAMFSSIAEAGQASVSAQSLPDSTRAASVATIAYQVAGGRAGSSIAMRKASRL